MREHLLLARRVEGDRLMLTDACMREALDGVRPLAGAERAALEQSPLTLRRFRHLALERRAAEAWAGSAGMLRAAASGEALAGLSTDDGCWTLHFVEDGAKWQVILALAAVAPFAARLMREPTLLRVRDGAGTVVLQGHLDADGECEGVWPFVSDPAPHFQRHGGGFAVEPVRA
nr:hypothetical protein [Massilia polaris]